jgi:cytosine/adenosine deaminase-related metal-dependent hydrolase
MKDSTGQTRPWHLRVDAAAAIDPAGHIIAPATLLVRFDHAPPATPIDPAPFSCRVLPTPDADRLPPAESRLDRRGHLLLPALINAHTHLDLTHLGPAPQARGDFPAFIDLVRAGRASTPPDIARSVRLGIQLSLAAGVAAVGDIAGSPRGSPELTPLYTLASSPLSGVSFLEFFAIGSREQASIQTLQSAGLQLPTFARIRAGLQPHAPYSVGLAGYLAAAELADRFNLPQSTHLAESAAEQEFIAHARGPHRALLESLGLWNDDLARSLGAGRSPVQHLRPWLERPAGRPPKLLVHLNQLSDEDVALVASSRSAAVYCPRSSEYFLAHDAFGPHRYRDLLAHGVPVALGTDSILNLPDQTPGHALSVLDEMRFLAARDHTDPATLLRMATLHGAHALGLPDAAVRLFDPASPDSRPLGVIAIPSSPNEHPLQSVLQRTESPEFLCLGNSYE